MKHRIALLLALTSLSASAIAASPCQEKEQDIQREISYAEKHHNQSRIDGLNTALRQVRENCSDSKLKADHQQKIAKQRDDTLANGEHALAWPLRVLSIRHNQRRDSRTPSTSPTAAPIPTPVHGFSRT